MRARSLTLPSAFKPVSPRLPTTISEAPIESAVSTIFRRGESSSASVTGSTPAASISDTDSSASPDGSSPSWLT